MSLLADLRIQILGIESIEKGYHPRHFTSTFLNNPLEKEELKILEYSVPLDTYFSFG